MGAKKRKKSELDEIEDTVSEGGETKLSEEDGDSLAGSSTDSAAVESESKIEEVSAEDRDVDLSVLDCADEDNIRAEAPSELVGELQAEVAETQQNYLRALADLENFKKRSIRERSEMLKYQGERVFIDIVEILDDLDLALDHSKAEGNASEFLEGIELIQKKFLDVLTKWNVKGVSAVGEPFDPNMHNALSSVPSDEMAPGHVLKELKKAYFYKDKLIRQGEVVVSAAPAESEDSPNSGSQESGSAKESTEPSDAESVEN